MAMGWVRGRIGRLQRISRSLARARIAGARDVGDCMVHNPWRGDGEGHGSFIRALPYPFLVPWACSDGMVVVSGKWDIGRDWRLEDGVNLRAEFACRWSYIIPLCTSYSEDSAQEISFFF
jgi:hypothetical protein